MSFIKFRFLQKSGILDVTELSSLSLDGDSIESLSLIDEVLIE